MVKSMMHGKRYKLEIKINDVRKPFADGQLVFAHALAVNVRRPPRPAHIKRHRPGRSQESLALLTQSTSSAHSQFVRRIAPPASHSLPLQHHPPPALGRCSVCFL